ncbi:MAG: hypothetical protein Q9217_000312 [Psora testacea]
MYCYKSLLLDQLLTLQLSRSLFLWPIISMSDGPSRLLQNLKLDEMPVTRSQGQTSQPGRGARGQGRGRLDPLARPSPPASRSGPSRPPAVTSNVPRGHSELALPVRLAPYISVDHFQHINQNHPHNVSLPDDSYYAIQLNPVSLYPLIGGHEADLPAQLNSLRGPEVEPPETPEVDISEASNLFARSDALCDILSTFDHQLLPEEFRRDFVDRAPPVVNLESCLEPQNLYVTTYQMAIVDRAVFEALRRTVSPDHCAERYIAKQNLRINEVIARLDHADQTHTGVPAAIVIDCAHSLRVIVHQLCQDRAKRPPLAVTQARRLSTILVELVQKVCDRNRDLRVGDRPRARSRNHNLYTYLIGDPPVDPAAPAYMNDAFVVDRLRVLSSDDWKHLFEDLTNIRDEIVEYATENERASLAYAAKLDEMLGEYTIHANEPSSSSAQMRMPGP